MTYPQDSDKLLITVEEAARRLSIGRSHLYDYLLTGSLHSIRIGRSRRIACRDLDAFVARLREVNGGPELVDDRLAKTGSEKSVPETRRRR